jgi:hypothetical protein
MRGRRLETESATYFGGPSGGQACRNHQCTKAQLPLVQDSHRYRAQREVDASESPTRSPHSMTQQERHKGADFFEIPLALYKSSYLISFYPLFPSNLHENTSHYGAVQTLIEGTEIQI